MRKMVFRNPADTVTHSNTSKSTEICNKTSGSYFVMSDSNATNIYLPRKYKVTLHQPENIQ